MRSSHLRIPVAVIGLVLIAGTVPLPTLAQPATTCGVHNYHFQEPFAPMLDVLPGASVTYGINGFFDINVYVEALPICISSIDFIHDQSQISLSQIIGVGQYSSFSLLSWVEMIDSSSPKKFIRLWPNPTHLAPNPANDVTNCIVPQATSFSCWDHKNIPSFYEPTFPVFLRHHTQVSYLLDFSDKQVDHYCDYQIDKAGKVTLSSCSRNEVATFK